MVSQFGVLFTVCESVGDVFTVCTGGGSGGRASESQDGAGASTLYDLVQTRSTKWGRRREAARSTRASSSGTRQGGEE